MQAIVHNRATLKREFIVATTKITLDAMKDPSLNTKDMSEAVSNVMDMATAIATEVIQIVIPIDHDIITFRDFLSFTEIMTDAVQQVAGRLADTNPKSCKQMLLLGTTLVMTIVSRMEANNG